MNDNSAKVTLTIKTHIGILLCSRLRIESEDSTQKRKRDYCSQPNRFIFASKFLTMSLLSDLINLNLSETTEKIIAEYIWLVSLSLTHSHTLDVFGCSVRTPKKRSNMAWWFCVCSCVHELTCTMMFYWMILIVWFIFVWSITMLYTYNSFIVVFLTPLQLWEIVFSYNFPFFVCVVWSIVFRANSSFLSLSPCIDS